MKTDTIVAIATALSDSGIGVIRVSGPDALQAADKIFQTKNGKHPLMGYESHTIHYGYIVDGDQILDEVMISVMKAPRSYTREDTVEISCHGGVLLLRKVLDAVLKNGARLAEPGEFTKRAFLNGRIDLSRAEAVMDLIQSENDFALRASIDQLRGSVSDEIKSIRSIIIYEIAFIESALDDPEHISTEGYTQRLGEIVDKLLVRLQRLLDSAEDGRLRREGINTVIVGKPNAGKSSFLNLLIGEERAIVTDVAGTTRDTLEESILLKGIGLNIVDTAGIRSTEDIVEKIGVEKAKRYAGNADLIIYVVDSSVPLDESDRQIIEMIRGKKVIVLLNKTDLETMVTKEELRNLLEKEISDFALIGTSTVDRTGMEELESAIQRMFLDGVFHTDGQVVITGMRHKEAIRDAYQSILMVKESLEQDMPEDFYSIDLMSAYSSLGTIIGEEVGEDLVNEIFSRFCMGK